MHYKDWHQFPFVRYCKLQRQREQHYNNVIMGMIASQITSLAIVYSTVYSDADQRKHQSSASLAFVRGIHRGPVNSPQKWPVTQKMFPFDDVSWMLLTLKPFLCIPDPFTVWQLYLHQQYQQRMQLTGWHRIKVVYMMTSLDGNISTLLALFEENNQSLVDSPHKVSVMQSYDVPLLYSWATCWKTNGMPVTRNFIKLMRYHCNK